MANFGNTINSFTENAKSALVTMGRAALHSLSPDNFEYYLCSLELLDSSGNSKGFMSFSVMPNNITETKSQIATISKTNSGVVSVFNSTFVPRDISIQGTFGRKLRLLLGMKETENVSTIPFFGGNFATSSNDVLIKTGYGLTKMLKSMVDESFKLDDKGNPCILIFSNHAFNTHYIVEVLQSSFSQSVENNMLWYYSLEMKAVAPADAIKKQNERNSKLLTTVASDIVAKGISNMLNNVYRKISL